MQNKPLKQKISNNKKSMIVGVAGIVFGIIISVGATIYAASKNDAWNLGDGWMWFATASDSQVHANVEAPVDDSNVTNKSYVDAAGGGGGGNCYTKYNKGSTRSNPGSCPDCPEGWTREDCLGVWGYCHNLYSNRDIIYYPPGGGCPGGEIWWDCPIGQAALCCKN